MSATVIVGVIFGVFFVIGLVIGVIVMISWPSSRAHRLDYQSRPPSVPDPGLDDEPDDPPEWPARRR